MQHGTEVPLAYNTTITFKDKPTNLVFYSNSEKTEALIIENEKYLNVSGFFSLEDYKKRYVPIYWEWKYMTGNTQEEIFENDLIDVKFNGKTMSMKIETTGEQVTEKPIGRHVVTFNANGGIFPKYGNTRIATKQVMNGEQYGETPIPTREGYRFAGWSTTEETSESEDNVNLYALWTEF